MFFSAMVPGVPQAIKRGDYLGVVNLIQAHSKQEQAYFNYYHHHSPEALATIGRLSKNPAVRSYLHSIGWSDAQLAALRVH
jgi:hypothetical protein